MHLYIKFFRNIPSQVVKIIVHGGILQLPVSF